MDGLHDLQIYDYLRIATMITTVFAARRLFKLVLNDRHTYSTRLSEWVWFIFAVLFTQFVGAFEQLLGNTEYRYSGVLSFLIALAAARAARPGGPLQRK